MTAGARRPTDRQVQEGLHDRSGCHHGDHARNRRLEPAYKQHAVVDDERGVVLDVEVTTGEINEGQVVRAHRRDDGDDRRADHDRHRRCRLCLRQGLWRARAAWNRRGDPGEGGADPQPGAAAPLPLRRQERHREVPARQDPAAETAGRAWPLLLCQRATARLRPGSALSVQGTGQQGCRDQRRLSRRSCGPAAGASDGGTRTGGSTSAIAGARRASTARPRLGTAWRAPSGAGSKTCASRPS